MMPNYRPAALTAIICKILEKLIVAAILAFLAAWNLLSPEQHGFIKGRSCQTNILLCYELWTKIVDDGKVVDIISFNFAKAFQQGISCTAASKTGGVRNYRKATTLN